MLSVNGIGPETADDILLYAYTRRLFKSLSLIVGDEPCETLRHGFETCLEPDFVLFNEYHALIVRHAKEKCREVLDCQHCYVEQPFL